ncbi:uncharacterized protein LOC121855615 [Homarus americanus]|uniref:G-protein coupled receptors family 1 profile domain-containing protein n=1 Tax=Homarus americanus TaxID=6706 RepID=A0A8J5JG38_HOMAM|nr:uncharacterized protein LOC121855615 [Homarus americanus]XP_042206606.1 uncharacterized protein LOC121855615 [Homarus americanus]KAG7154945.1 hypothetical protein Hamer_G021955 [Homarus americanus]
MINCTEPNCQRCYEKGLYGPDEPAISSHLLKFAAVHCYLVFLLGTTCNGVALWCIATCTKTRPAVKVLLCSVFVPIMVICLVVQPCFAEMLLALLTCDDLRAPWPFKVAVILFYSTLAQMELVCIATISVLRVAAVWSSHRHSVGLRAAVGIVVTIIVYSVLITPSLLGSLLLLNLKSRLVKRAISFLYFFLNTMVPILVTISCYVVMMIAVRRNRLRLADSHSQSRDSVVDQATRAMMAVFVNNLLLGFPHSVYHLLEDPPRTAAVGFHILFYTHFVVDPVVFVWFNRNYRKRVSERVIMGLRWMTRCCSSSPLTTTASTFTLHVSSSSTPSTHQKSTVSSEVVSENMKQ